MHAIVCVPLGTPTVLHVNHHRAASDGWNSDSQCHECSEDFRLTIQPFVGCNVCLRQPPSLRNTTSHTVFHLTFNLSQFTLSGRTLYHQYLYAVESNVVPNDRLIPLSFYHVIYSFVRDK